MAASVGVESTALLAPTRFTGLDHASVVSLMKFTCTTGSILQKRRRLHINVLPEFSEALQAAAELGSRPQADIGSTFDAVGRLLLGSEVVHVANDSSIGCQLGVERRDLPDVLRLLASAVVAMGAARRARLEGILSETLPRQCCVRYVEFAAYDETPLPVQMKDDRADRPPELGGRIVHAGMASGAVAPLGLASLSLSACGLHVSTTGINQRIVQSYCGGAAVFKVGQQYLVMWSKAITPLAVVESNRAAVMKELQLRVSGVTEWALAFKRQSRITCTDAHAAAIACERSIGHDRMSFGNADSMHKKCEVHCTAGVFKKTFALIDGNISGMLNCALAMRSGSAMARFRSCLAEEIRSRLDIRHGRPSREAMSYKAKVLQLFVSHGASLATRRALLLLAPNGDWRSQKVEFYVSAGLGAISKREDVIEHLTSGLTAALCSSQPRLYPRSRWTGADLATDDLGILECVHKLLSTTFFRFAASHTSGALRSMLLDAGRWAAMYEPATHTPIRDSATEPGADDDHADDGLPGLPVMDSQATSADWIKMNAKRRRLACAWLATSPLGHIMLQRLCMEPLRVYMERQLKRAGADWEACQPDKVAASDGARRDFRPTEIANGSDDKRLQEQVGMLFNQDEMWAAFPPGWRTVGNRNLAFRMLSRLSCCHWQMLGREHARFPLQLFRLLDDPALADRVLSTPNCLLDDFTKAMKSEYPELRGPEFEVVLSTVAIGFMADTSFIEARHAAVRRTLLASSLQTHQMNFQNLSARWCLQQFRRRCVQLCPRRSPAKHE